MPESTNEERILRALDALEAYHTVRGEGRDNVECLVGDLVTDLMHYLAREGGDVALMLRCAERDFAAERRPAGSSVAWLVTVVRKVSRRMSVDELAEVAVEAVTAAEAEAAVQRLIDSDEGTERFDDLFDEVDSSCVGSDIVDGPAIGKYGWQDDVVPTVPLSDDHPVHLRAAEVLDEEDNHAAQEEGT